MEEGSIMPKPQLQWFASQAMLAVSFPFFPHMVENNWFFFLFEVFGEMVELSLQHVYKSVIMGLPCSNGYIDNSAFVFKEEKSWHS